jgi:hypothetical protein
MMQPAIASYRKTLIASTVAAISLFIMAYATESLMLRFLPASMGFLLIGAATIFGMFLLLVALSSLLAIYRHVRLANGGRDLFLSANADRSDTALVARKNPTRSIPFPSIRRLMGAPAYVVGDMVRIRPIEEIAKTLDANGCLDGMPFMPEMTRFCGTTGTVFRCVDKVYDYGGKKDLRRIKETVLLAGLRCDGSGHDGCQTGCYLLWKTDWLERAQSPAWHVPNNLQEVNVVPHELANVKLGRTYFQSSDAPVRKYVCQYTEIVNASTKMRNWDLRQDVRPFIAGNMTLRAFGIATLTWLFNAVQGVRGGIGYPLMKTGSSTIPQPVNLGLQPGEAVRVAAPDKIFATLNKTSKNLGLWFDREMLKHCGHRYVVLRRVDKIIDDASRQMIQMKTPCIVLDALDASGEHLRFCAQHDYPFWREAWLERMVNPHTGEAVGSETSATNARPDGR